MKSLFPRSHFDHASLAFLPPSSCLFLTSEKGGNAKHFRRCADNTLVLFFTVAERFYSFALKGHMLLLGLDQGGTTSKKSDVFILNHEWMRLHNPVFKPVPGG